MKIKYLPGVVVGFFLMSNIMYASGTKPGTVAIVNGSGTTDAAHDTVWITGSLSNPGNFEKVINGDTITDKTNNNFGKGMRYNINTVYVLAANTIYLEQAGLTVTDSLGTLTIIGLPSGGTNQKPVLLYNENNGTGVTCWKINASLTVKNIQNESFDIQGKSLSDGFDGDWYLSGNNITIDIEDCMEEFQASYGWINAQACPQGLKAFYRGNYFRDFVGANSWWAGRAFYAKVPVDTLVFVNNTITFGGLMCLQQNSLTQYAFIDHNTIIDNIKYPFQNPFYLTCFFTNNLIVNSNLAGEDSINIIKHESQDPTILRHGVIGVDSINRNEVSLIQNKYKVYQNSPGIGTWTIDTSQCGPGHIKFYAAGNVLVSDTNQVFYNYWHGINPKDGKHDSAYSYLTWNVSKPGPYGLVNYPETFINSRGVAMAAKYPGIVISSANPNSVYSMPTQALKMKTSCLDTSQVKWWIQWNRSQYLVPNVSAPALSRSITFGDCDPATISGPNGVEVPYKSSTGGITAFTDLNENFNQTVALSTLDGLPVGSFIWGTKTYNETTSLNTVRDAYNLESGYSGVNTSTDVTSITLNCYPNPASSAATFTFTLPNPTHINLTVYNLLGKVMTTLINENMPEGAHSVEYNPAGLPKGIYIYVLTTNETVVKGKMILEK